MLRRSVRRACRHRVYTAPAFRQSLAADPRLDVPLTGLFRDQLAAVPKERRGNVSAFECAATGRALTFDQVTRLTDAYAAAFYHLLKIERGDVVCVLSPNSEFYCSLFHAILHLGGVVSPINTLATPAEIDRHMALAGSKVLITSNLQHDGDQSPAVTADTNAHDGSTRKTLHLGRLGFHPDKLRVDVPLFAVNAAAEIGAAVRKNAKPDDTIVLPFSSGTTGLPKGVQLTNRSLVANYLQTHQALHFSPTDVSLSILPFFHIYGMLVLLHCVLLAGGRQVTFPKFDMEQYLLTLAKQRATLCFVAPPVMVGFIKHPLTKKTDTTSVRWVFSGAAPLGEAVQRQCESLFPKATIGQGYGLTETSPVLCSSATPAELGGKETPYGTAGLLVADTEARIVDVSAERNGDDAVANPSTLPDVAEGEEGELWTRGPQTMKGYLRAEDTAKVFVPANDAKDGGSNWGPWFRTGDIGKFRPCGHFEVTDRLKDLIKYKGYQVPPAELEALLQSHHDVQDAVVVGLPAADVGNGEVPAAWVVLKPGLLETDFGGDEAKAAKAFVEFVAAQVNPHKQLRGGVTIVDAIPKTASGKLLRRTVRDELLKSRKA